MFDTSHGAGKGDKDRSPGWRDNYDSIFFPGVTGLRRKNAATLIKVYRPAPPAEEGVASC